jgi:hypothetical protein
LYDCYYQLDATAAPALIKAVPNGVILPEGGQWFTYQVPQWSGGFYVFHDGTGCAAGSWSTNAQFGGCYYVGSYAGISQSLVFVPSGFPPPFGPYPTAFYVLVPHAHVGTVGVKVASVSRLIAHVPTGTVGIKVAPRTPIRATVGIKPGVASALRGRVSATVGIKPGVASALRGRVPTGTIGIKPGVTSTIRVKVPATVGIKPGVASTVYAGIVTNCCPGAVVPATLTGTDGGAGSITAIYQSSTQHWNYTDPSSGVAMHLQCSTTGPPFNWILRPNATAHCGFSDTLNSLTCHPFAIDVEVLVTGALCLAAGSYRVILH